MGTTPKEAHDPPPSVVDGTTDTRTVPPRGAETVDLGPELERGISVGRYVLLDRIGRGAMGVVYKAYDPELDRAVAVKLVAARAQSAHARDRLLREAQALARLSHPNVVNVFDVGPFGKDVYLAMEFVPGVTLADWLARAPRSRAEVLRVLSAAGEGLAAAHRAGLVHRDFKPANVILGDDQRVRVLDFGVARAAASAPESVPPALTAAPGLPGDLDLGTSSERALSQPLTEAGNIVGTPRYMAPEQHEGGTADARSDQFAFCVVLYEALYRQHPYAGLQRSELAAAVKRGALPAPPAQARVPRWLRGIVTRGLAPVPADRFTSMDALLAALRRDPARLWRRGALAAAVVGVPLLILLLGQRAALPRPCRGAATHVDRVWNPERKQVVAAAFAATHAPYAGSAARAVETQLDRYARAWTAMHTETCEATRVSGEQSAELLDIRMACLDQRLAALAGQIDVFATADVTVVANAAQAAASLPPLQMCADVNALRQAVQPSPSGEERRRVEALRAERAHAQAMHQAGKSREALPLAQAALAQARALGYAPLTAETALTLAEIGDALGELDLAEAALHEALAAATAGRHDDVAAAAWIQYVFHVGDLRGRFAEALGWVPLVRGLLTRLARPERHTATLENQVALLYYRDGKLDLAMEHAQVAHALLERAYGADSVQAAGGVKVQGNILLAQGKLDEAIVQYQLALTLSQRSLGAEHPKVGALENNLGVVYLGQARYDQALVHLERALAIYRAAYGDDNLDVADELFNIGIVLRRLAGRSLDAIAYFERALAIQERVRGRDAVDVAYVLVSYGEALLDEQRADEGRAMLERAVRILVATVGPDHPDLATAYRSLGDEAALRHRFDEALGLYRRALDIAVRRLGEEHEKTAEVLTSIAGAQAGKGQLELAQRTYQRALAAADKSVGPDHPTTAAALLGQGLLRLRLGAPEAAARDLERALTIRRRTQEHPRDLAEAELALARALWATPGARPRALELARHARDTYAELGAPAAPMRREAEAWLTRRR